MKPERKRDLPLTPLYLWELEYLHQGIPSSFRFGPSGFLQDFLVYLRQKGRIEQKHALDLGCGRGRNAFYLARQGLQVTCVDYVQGNIDHINSISSLERLPVRALCEDVTLGLPLEDDSIDFAIDIFCYKHQTGLDERACYRKELLRLVKPSGYLFISLAAIDDGFYGPLLSSSPEDQSGVVIDPVSGLASVLFSEDTLVEEFSDTFKVLEVWNKRKEGLMHGKCYLRSSIAAILQPR